MDPWKELDERNTSWRPAFPISETQETQLVVARSILFPFSETERLNQKEEAEICPWGNLSGHLPSLWRNQLQSLGHALPFSSYKNGRASHSLLFYPSALESPHGRPICPHWARGPGLSGSPSGLFPWVPKPQGRAVAVLAVCVSEQKLICVGWVQ